MNYSIDVLSLLNSFASDLLFSQKFALAFGQSVTPEAYLSALETLPTVEIRSDAELQGALGAFSAQTGKIYLSESLIQGSPSQYQATVIEELGHYLDYYFNGNADSDGDEGDIFSRLVRGETIDQTTLQGLKIENDHATITLDGQVIEVEQASVNITSSTIPKGFIITPDAGSTINLGWNVKGNGDFNNDGFQDFVILAPEANGGAGELYVVYGSSDLTTSSVATIKLNSISFGLNPIAIGDINNDGQDDIIIGDPGDSADELNSGKTHIIYGDSVGNIATDVSTLDGTNGFTIVNDDGINEFLGYSVSSGDINGDKIDDVIIGDPVLNDSQGGRVYVVFGGGSFSSTFDINTATSNQVLTITAPSGSIVSGFSVASGNIGGSAADDIIIGTSGLGINSQIATYVIFGNNAISNIATDITQLDGTNGFSFTSPPPASSTSQISLNAPDSEFLEIQPSFVLIGFLSKVSSAGDINGDSFDDFIVNTFNFNSTPAQRTYVVFGGSTFDATMSVNDIINGDGSKGFYIDGLNPDDGFNEAISAAGDINNDGIDDLLFTEPGNDTNGLTDSGQVYVIYGKTSGFGAEVKLNALSRNDGYLLEIDSLGINDQTGYSVSNAGDINGDGIDDFLVGAPGVNSGDGAVYVVLGQGEIPVNTETLDNQDKANVAALTGGGFVIVWESTGQDGDLDGIFGQRFNQNGAKVGNEFQINNTIANNQRNPVVIGLNDGGYVVAWQSTGQDGNLDGIFGQKYNSNGVAVGAEFRLNTQTLDQQQFPTLSALNDGGFVAAWQTLSRDGDAFAIVAQRFDSNGTLVGPEFQVNTTTASTQTDPAIATLKDGSFVIIWESFNQDGNGFGVYARRYDSQGNVLTGEFLVNSTTTNNQNDPAIAALEDGGFLIVWESFGQDGEGLGIYAQRFNSSANAIGNEFLINTYTPNNQGDPSVTGLKDGGFLITWESTGQDGSFDGIYGQRYDSNSNPVGGEFQVNDYTTSSQSNPSVTTLESGKQIIAWESIGQDGSGTGIYAKLFSSANPTDIDIIPDGNNADENPDNSEITDVLETGNITTPDPRIVGILKSTDPDSTTHSYTFVSGEGDDDNNKFEILEITPGTYQIRLKNSQVFDYEAQRIYSVRVQSKDGDGGIYEEALQINVISKPEPNTTVTFVDQDVLIGENQDFFVTFNNTADPNRSNVGYAPFIDLFIDSSGVDGDDGISILLNSLRLKTTQGFDVSRWQTLSSLGVTPITVTIDSNEQFVHPLDPGAGLINAPAGFGAGDTLVVIPLPQDSIGPAQPTITIYGVVNVSNKADYDKPLNIASRGGFGYGPDPIPILNAGYPLFKEGNTATNVILDDTDIISPHLFRFAKTGPYATVTGPNFRQNYQISLQIASGQTIDNLDFQDQLDKNVQYLNNSSSPLANSVTVNPGNGLGSLVNANYLTASNFVGLNLGFYIPREDNMGAFVINPNTGAASLSNNNTFATANNWVPLDNRDVGEVTFPLTEDNLDTDWTHTNLAIALQKRASLAVNNQALGLGPGDVIEYTLNFQVSDYFAFGNVRITDNFSDGQVFDSSFTPTLTINEHGTIYNPTLTFSQGGNTLTFDVKDGDDNQLLGGRISETTGFDDSLTFGATTGTIKFRTIIQENFSLPVSSGDQSVDVGDYFTNSASLNATILEVDNQATLFSQLNPVTTGASTGFYLSASTLDDYQVSVYGIDGKYYQNNPAQSYPERAEILPGDDVTYRIKYKIPFEKIENLTFESVLPFPVLDVDDLGNTISNWSGILPTKGNISYGPDHNFAFNTSTQTAIKNPTITKNDLANSITFDYGDYDETNSGVATIDLLFTLELSSEPTDDRLLLTNYIYQDEGRSNTSFTNGHSWIDVAQLELIQPALRMTKGVVAFKASDSGVKLSQPIPNSISFTDPNSSGTRFTGNINSNLLHPNPTNFSDQALNSDLIGETAQDGVVPCDLVTFAIVVENTGTNTNGAFDILIKDILPQGFNIPRASNGLNLTITNGVGETIGYEKLGGGLDGVDDTDDDLFGNGIRLIDPSENKGAIAAYNATSGENIAIITFDLEVTSPVTSGEVITSEATLEEYANTNNGLPFLASVLALEEEVNVKVGTVNYLNGTAGRDGDILTGNDDTDIITGFEGRDILTGNGGNDQFVYTSFTHAGDIIKDFTVGKDKIVLTQLLDSLSYSGSDPIADGYVQFSSQGSSNSYLRIDGDGFAGPSPSRTFALLENVSVADLNAPRNFVF